MPAELPVFVLCPPDCGEHEHFTLDLGRALDDGDEMTARNLAQRVEHLEQTTPPAPATRDDVVAEFLARLTRLANGEPLGDVLPSPPAGVIEEVVSTADSALLNAVLARLAVQDDRPNGGIVAPVAPPTEPETTPEQKQEPRV